MASPQAIAISLGIMHECFPTRSLTENTGEVWLELFRDVGDDAYLTAVRTACNQSGRTFFPTPGELRLILFPPPPLPDIPRTIGLISKLGKYHASAGWLDPNVETVRDAMGDAVAIAYGAVGPSRLYSDNETTRDIAARDFAGFLDVELSAPRPPLARIGDPRPLLPRSM